MAFAPERNRVQVVRCKGCKRCIPISVEAVIGSVTVICPVCPGTEIVHCDDGSVSRAAELGSYADAPGETMTDERAQKADGMVAVVAGLIAAVKPARVDGAELNGKESPRVRCALLTRLRSPEW